MSQELAIPAPSTALATRSRGVQLETMKDIWDFAKIVSNSGLAPRGMESPEKVFIAVEMGLELGLSPMMALQNIGVINGKAGVYGDAALALVRQSGLLETFKEWMEGTPGTDAYSAVCLVKRKGYDEKETRFTIADAKKAKLWGKAGPWEQYPSRMQMFRARGFALRDEFADVLKGFVTTEELQDYPEDTAPRPHPKTGSAPSEEVPEAELEPEEEAPVDPRPALVEKYNKLRQELSDLGLGVSIFPDVNERMKPDVLGKGITRLEVVLIAAKKANEAKRPDGGEATPTDTPDPGAATTAQLSAIQTIARRLYPEGKRDEGLGAYLVGKYGVDATLYTLTKKQASDTKNDWQKQLDALANNTTPLPRPAPAPVKEEEKPKGAVKLNGLWAIINEAGLSADPKDKNARILAVNEWLKGRGNNVAITSFSQLDAALVFALGAEIESGTFNPGGWPYVVKVEGGDDG